MDKEMFPVVYCNLVKITHAGIEFLYDFKRLGPEATTPEDAPTLTRIILHPAVAKSFATALVDNIKKYEEKFGEIPPPPQPSPEHDSKVH
ncbi:MAG: DUF3467 domain-containing protein [Armatimonadetes bacterium]|nr:DUF3467 domain-containing protein [Armatimonadota bacterium]NIM24439.1 DUF3467 domain-containing protein [Armatimonadota bacterium]NIM68310.1 DUF3467 domain-containing protein [Armatimonadota bacterium]NIM76714.1 DUF3467 domain-containing protein [Armatimonadota bacterium]NIN06513.1 DUF3467 domain-containing protein [Armatimonadota bacterium]